MQAAVSAIEYYLPPKTVSTADLAAEFPEWAVDKIDEKMGIRERHVSAPGECASDLAVAAARRLFDSGACRPDQIDYVLLCTQSPDHFLPSTACLIQDRLGIPSGAGALDFNLGCSGYVYGLGLAQGLISSGQASTVLLITADTLTKFINPGDKSVRSVFGDAAAVTLLSADDSTAPLIGPFIYGTNGRGAPNLMVPAGGMRQPRNGETAVTVEDDGGNVRSRNDLFMDGAEIFTFSLDVVPQTVNSLLAKAGLQASDVDLFVFHQANRFMLEHLRKRLRIPAGKLQLSMSHCGNTVSSSIPIALKHAAAEGKLPPGALVMLVGFGVGYSWGGTLLRCSGLR
jgi:3-oxoacyl-[acyl-carrier-protein] synthase-3